MIISITCPRDDIVRVLRRILQAELDDTVTPCFWDMTDVSSAKRSILALREALESPVLFF